MMRNRWSAAWIVCVVLWGACSSFVLAAPLDDYNAALNLYEQKRWSTAALGFQQFLKQSPEHPKAPLAQLYLGQALTHSQRYEEARTVFRQFLEAHPKHTDAPLAAYRIGECSYFLNDSTAASVELERFVKDYPNHELAVWGWQYLGEARLNLKDAPGAAQAFEVVLNLKTDEAEQIEAKFHLARALEAMGQDDKAAEYYQQVAASNHPRAAEALFGRATAEYQTEKFDAAAKTFDELLTRFPKSPLLSDAQLNAGYSHYRLKDFAEAQKRFEAAAAGKTNELNATFWIGMCHESKSDWEGAAKVFEGLSAKVPVVDLKAIDSEMGAKAAKEYELGAKTMYHWAECESQLKKFDSAQQKFLAVGEKWPQSKLADDSLYSAADAALRGDRVADALELVTQFPTRFATSSLLPLNDMLKGRVLLARGDSVEATDLPAAQADFQQASELFQNIVTTSPTPRTSNQARILLGRAEKRLNHPQKVIEALTPLAELIKKGEKGSEEYADALPTLGEALFAEGRSSEAESVLIDSLKSLPENSERRLAILTKIVEVQATQNKWIEADATLDELAKADTSGELLAQSAFGISEQAIAKKEWTQAEKLLNRVIAVGAQGRYYIHALSQLGIVLSQQGQPGQAAEAYGKLVEAAKDDKLNSSIASYNRGLCLQKDAGQDEAKLLAAAKELAAAAELNAIPADKEIPDAVEQKAAVPAVKSARTAAMIYASLKQIDEADKLWQLAYRQIPKLQPADQGIAPDLLNEWAAHQFNAGDREKADGHIEKADEYYKKADEHYQQLYENYPESGWARKARLYVAQGHASAGRSEEARQLYEVLNSDPKVPAEIRLDVLQSWMKLEAHVRNWKEAQRVAGLITQSFASSPLAFEARFCIGEAQIQQGLDKEGFATLTDLRADPALPEAEWRPQLELLWAESQLNLKEHDRTPLRTALEAFLAKNPPPELADQAHEILGRADSQEGKFEEARQHWKLVVESKASEKSELAAKAEFRIGESYLAQKNYEDAILRYNNVYTNYPFAEWKAAALHQMGWCDMTQKDWAKAKSAFEKLISEFPDSEEAKKAAISLETVKMNLPATGTP